MQVLYLLEGIRTPFLDGFFSRITYLGSETLFLVAALIVFWCVSKRDGYYLLTVGFLGTLVSQLLKLVCRVPRPWVRDPDFTIVESARAEATGYSFPSGHTQNAVSAFGCPARSTKSPALRAVCVLLILLTGLSRMYLGVHTPADVAAALVIGGILVFVLYPLFVRGEENPALLYLVLGFTTVCALGYVLFVELYPWAADIDADNLAEGIKNGYVLLGSSCGLLAACFLDRNFIRFSTRAPLGAQVAKVALGLGLALALKTGLKLALAALMPGASAANAVRYFIVVLFAGCVWPLTFSWFSRGCPMRKGVKRVLSTLLGLLIALALLAGVLFWVVTRDTKAAPIETDGAANELITPLGVTMLSGHRAGGGVAPENTMMALKNCVENPDYQLDIFEFDLHLTADGVLVLLHDDTLDRTSDAAEVFGQTGVLASDKTFAELKQLNMGETFTTDDGKTPYAGLRGQDVPDDLRIISLTEALTYLEGCGGYHYIIEIKDSEQRGYEAADLLYATLSELGCLDRTVVGTFHNEVTAYLDETYPDLPRSAGMNECVKFYFCSLLNMKVAEDTFRFVALQIPTTDYVVNLGTSRVVNYAHKNNIAVQYWTINDPQEMARLQAIGADAVMTDVPDQAMGVLVQPQAE